MRAPSTSSTLFPYTTLFRSKDGQAFQTTTQDGQRYIQDGQSHRKKRRQQSSRHRPFVGIGDRQCSDQETEEVDRKSTRLNSSHVEISYAVFCLKKKKQKRNQ